MKRTFLKGLFWVALGTALYGQTPTISAVVDTATFNTANPRLAPGSLASVFGNNFGASKSIAVTFGGKQAYLIAVTNTQINLQIPVDAPVGATTVVVGTSAPFNVTLAQYAPAVLTANQRGTGPALFASANKGPFKAGDTFSLAVTGLGPTTPAIATGAATPGPAPVTTAKVTATIGGIAAEVAFAGLVPGVVALYQANVTVPAGLPSGDLALVLTVGGESSQAGVTVPIIGTVPGINAVVNAASGNGQTLPNGGIAQGAILILYGTDMGPATLAIDPNPFSSTSLLGTSVSVTIKGTTVGALMYYTSAGQVAALLPSNTPVGTGTVTVTYKGATSAPAPITVVASNAGIFTTPPGGSGAAVVSYPDFSVVTSIPVGPCGGPNTLCGAANPKDVLILWLTGLGPVNTPDNSGPQPGNMPNLPLRLFIGDVEAPVSYQGRSGCCMGVDQVVFTVPDNVPTGCAVPLYIQIDNQISNYTWIPVANGSRTCKPLSSTITPAALDALSSGGTVTSTQLKLRRRPTNNGSVDRVNAQFQKMRVVPGMSPFVLTLVDAQPRGTCYVQNSPNFDITELILQNQGGIDAGPGLTLTGPNGSKDLPRTVAAGQPTDYSATIGPGYFSPGTYTVTGPGGADVGPFTATLSIPAVPVWTNRAAVSTITRANGLTITWSGGASHNVFIFGTSFTDPNLTTGASFVCLAPGGPGTFTVPPSVLLALPAAPGSPNGSLTVQTAPPSSNFTASGLTVASIDFNANLTNSVTYK